MDNQQSSSEDIPIAKPTFSERWARIIQHIKRYFEKRRTKKETQNPADRAARSTARATWLIAVLTAVIVGVGYYQWRALNSTDSHIARQVEITTAVMKLDQRAWIGLESLDAVPIFPEIEKSFGAHGVIRNTGKTPATKIFIYSVIEPVLAEGRPNFSYVGVTGFGGGMLPPNGKGFLPLTVVPEANSKNPALFKQEQLDMLKSRRFSIYAHGRVEYADIFGDLHWMTYCSYLLPTGGFGFCAEHNETDDINKK